MVSGDFRNTSTIYPLHLNVEDYLKIDLICLFENNIFVVWDVIKLDILKFEPLEQNSLCIDASTDLSLH